MGGERARFLTAGEIAAEFGFSTRHWTRQAANGTIPGAYQPSGPGGHWLFDKAAFQRWWASRQREVSQWRGYTGADQFTGAASSVAARNSGRASGQEIAALLKSVLGNG